MRCASHWVRWKLGYIASLQRDCKEKRLLFLLPDWHFLPDWRCTSNKLGSAQPSEEEVVLSTALFGVSLLSLCCPCSIRGGAVLSQSPLIGRGKQMELKVTSSLAQLMESLHSLQKGYPSTIGMERFIMKNLRRPMRLVCSVNQSSFVWVTGSKCEADLSKLCTPIGLMILQSR